MENDFNALALLRTARFFNRHFARTNFTQGTPEVTEDSGTVHLRVRLQPYNDAGVDSLDVWVTGDQVSVSIAAQHAGDTEESGFTQTMARKEFTLSGESPEDLSQRILDLVPNMA
jgi:hypothetical protein